GSLTLLGCEGVPKMQGAGPHDEGDEPPVRAPRKTPNVIEWLRIGSCLRTILPVEHANAIPWRNDLTSAIRKGSAYKASGRSNGNHPAVRAKGQRTDCEALGKRFESLEDLPRAHVIDEHDAVDSSDGEESAVGRESKCNRI